MIDLGGLNIAGGRGKDQPADDFNPLLPKFKDPGEIYRWLREEDLPGRFPYTAGVFPFKRTGEDPTRMFAGEGDPARTNRRFRICAVRSPAITVLIGIPSNWV